MRAELHSVQINPETLQNAAGKACALLKILSNPDRLLLLCQLSHGEYAVAELEALAVMKTLYALYCDDKGEP